MKRLLKSTIGVTLLEIMLVLAIASMVIVMSIRYYQNATNSQNANTIMEQLEAITAAADNLAQGSNSYSGIGNSSGVATIVGAKNMTTPYNGAITIAGAGATYTVSLTAPVAVCTAIVSKLKANSRYVSPACTSAGVLTYTYNSAVTS
jgi:type II secretory pathway pseudopilin PulG